MKQTRLVEFQRPKFGALRKQDREAIYQAVRNRFGPNHSISMSELEYEYERTCGHISEETVKKYIEEQKKA